MTRPWLALTAVLLALAGTAPAADKAPAGTWKVLLASSSDSPAMLVRLQEQDGAWSGKALGSALKAPGSREALHIEVTRVTLRDGVLTLGLKLGSRRATIEAKLPTDNPTRLYGI